MKNIASTVEVIWLFRPIFYYLGVQSQPSNTQAKPNAQTLQCPFKKEMKCEFKPTNNLHAFRMHFFQHYPVEQYWEERVRLFHNYYCQAGSELNFHTQGSNLDWF